MEKFVSYDKGFESKRIGAGYNATCYLTSDNQVFKKIRCPEFFEKNLNNLVGLNISSFVFPNQIVLQEGKIIGYLMEYVKGVELDYIDKKISLKEYLDALRLVEYDIAALTNYRIYTIDVKPENILYTEDKKFKIVDTDYYEKVKSKRGLYSDNISHFGQNAVGIFVNPYAARFYDRKLEVKRGDLLSGRLTPTKYLLSLLEYMRINDPASINLGEMESELKLLYKTAR